jgi:hypothetical protein
MTKHTPGPWFTDHLAEPYHMATCLVDNPTWIAIGDTDAEAGHVAYCAPANAPLIADAPAMLEALEIAFNALRSSAGPEERASVADTLWALIAKHMEPNQ